MKIVKMLANKFHASTMGSKYAIVLTGFCKYGEFYREMEWVVDQENFIRVIRGKIVKIFNAMN